MRQLERGSDLTVHSGDTDIFYEMARLSTDTGISLENILQRTAELIPSALSSPEDTCARVVLEGTEYTTENFERSGYLHSMDLHGHSGHDGRIEVYRLRREPEPDQPVFSAEELDLLQTVGKLVENIIERTRATKRLERSERKYREIFEASPEVISLLDTEGRVQEINPTLHEWLGYSTQKIKGKSLDEIPYFTPESRRKVMKKFRRRMQGEDFPPYEIEVIDKDGEKHVGLVRGTLVHGEDGLTGDLVLMSDITERKRTEEALRSSERRYRNLFNKATVGIFRTTSTGRPVEVNPEMARIVGCDSCEEAIARFGELEKDLYVKPERRQEFLEQIQEHGEVRDFVYQAKRADGEKIWLSMTARISERKDDGTFFMDGFTQDITARRRAEEKLRQTQRQLMDQDRHRALSEMASGIAHDFNNALSTIRGFADLLLQKPEKIEDRETVTRYLKLIDKAAAKASETVRRMRKFYRPEEREEFVPLDLNEVVEEAVSITRPRWEAQVRADGGSIMLHRRLNATRLVNGDEAELHEVVTNLLFNAIHAMPVGGSLGISTRDAGEEVVLEVSDTGSGMSEEVRKRCMDPFFTTKSEHGSGLGLSIVHGIVNRHKGRIDVESVQGQGSTFRVHLPAAEESRLARDDAEEETDETENLRVLVVEDEPEQRELLTEYLRMDDHDVETAPGGREGIEAFAKGRYDLVITDRSMPRMAGDEMSEKITARAPGQPIIMLTGFGDMMDAAGETPENVDLVLSKPIVLKDLRQAIEELCGPR